MDFISNLKKNIKTNYVPLRIANVIGSGIIGGAENFVYQLTDYQNTKCPGIESAIIFRSGNGPFYEKALKQEIIFFACTPEVSLAEFINIIKLFREYDLIHFHGFYPTLFLAAIFARRKCLYYVHGARSLTKTPIQVLDSFVASRGNKLPTFKGLVRVLKRQWFKFFLKYYCEHIHAPSNYYVEFYRQNYGIRPSHISRLPLGINFDILKPQLTRSQVRKSFGLAPDDFVIGCISTFRKLKRIDRLINGFSHLHSANLPVKAKLIIVGDGAERESLKNLSSLSGSANDIIFTGFLQDVASILNAIDVFVLPSEFESFSIASVEAMYFSKPVIVFKGSGGVEEITREYSNGIIVEDEDDLAKELIKLSGQKSNTNSVRLSETTYAKFDPNNVVDKYSMSKYVKTILKYV